MWQCRKCGGENEEQHRFCIMCGTPRQAEPAAGTAGTKTGGKRRLWLIPVVCLAAVVIVMGVLLRFHGPEGGRWVSLGSVHLDQEGLLQGFRQDNGEMFWFEDGKKARGWKDLAGYRYYFGDDGRAVTGWQTIAGERYYFEEDGTAASGLVLVDGENCYFEDGQPGSGLKLLDNRYYFFDSDGSMVTGWQEIGSDTYYFDSNGQAVTGWNNLSGADYYFNPDGKQANGWTEIGGQWLYLIRGALAQGWKDVEGGRYYFKDGAYATGFLQDGNDWYYLNDDGKMATGLTNIQGKWYGFDSNGLMLTDQELTKDGKTYSFRWDGIATHYTYKVENVFSTESDERYTFNMDNGDTWETSYYALDVPIWDCSELTFRFEIAEVLDGSAKGEWGMYAWTTDGEWELICEFKCTVQSVEIKQTFEDPISFYGYAFAMLEPYSSGYISVRINHSLYDVYAVQELI